MRCLLAAVPGSTTAALTMSLSRVVAVCTRREWLEAIDGISSSFNTCDWHLNWVLKKLETSDLRTVLRIKPEKEIRFSLKLFFPLTRPTAAITSGGIGV